MFRNLSITLAVLALTACAGDPLRDVPRLKDVDVAGPAPVVEAVAAPEERDENVGFFQRIMRQPQVAPEAAETNATAGVPADTDGGAAPVVETAKAADDATAQAPQTPWVRLFGGRKAPQTAKAEAATPDVPTDVRQKLAPGGAATVQKAALTSADSAKDDGAEELRTAAREGLFSANKAAQLTGRKAGLRDAVPGEVLPFGEIARACHVKRSQLGQEVAKYPERGSKYRVYDSAPGNVGLHTFYVTGFRDGCPRQFTAALAVFGSASMYEALRYGLPETARSKKPTDKAYEKLKSRLCGVGRSKPCGARISRVEKSTVFLSLYNRFEGAQGWANLLLSDGQVMARDVEG